MVFFLRGGERKLEFELGDMKKAVVQFSGITLKIEKWVSS